MFAGTVKYYKRYGDADYLVNTTANQLAYEFFRMGQDTDSEKVSSMISIALDKQPPLKSMVDLLAGMRSWGVL